MKTNSFIKSGLTLGLLLAAACGGPEPVEHRNPDSKDPVTEGESLTLEGQLNPAHDVSIAVPVRLALAWYPMLGEGNEGGAMTQPRSITTSEVSYEASFPANFRFHASQPPPAEALVPVGQGSTAKAALGILLAYQDMNGNGKLDTIPASGSPIDRVLGSSFSWLSAKSYMVAYVDSEQQVQPELKKGFNLVEVSEAGSKPVPMSTPLTLTLSGGAYFDLFVCEAAWNGETSPEGEVPCGLDFSQQ